jgi:hypothetical protein
MTDNDRIDQLEQGEAERRAGLVIEAAQRANWHDPAAAAKALDLTTIATPQAAVAAVRAYSAANSYMIKPELTQEDMERQWGQELLDGLLRGGR